MVWAKRWLQESAPKIKKYGVKRMVRDVLGVSRWIEFEGQRLKCAKSLRELLKAEQVRVILGET